ncbi:MAG: DNA-protecting protein DprA [Actinobacteria bacterium]|nr:DNA-protecting protein DprA [Actinomycetota bacterium]
MTGGADEPDITALRSAFIELAHCVEPADSAVGRLVERRGAPQTIHMVRGGSTGLRHGEGIGARLGELRAVDAERRAAKAGARIVTRVDSEWPTQLGDLGHEEPFALWVTGAADLRLLALRSVAVVGARACTAYGEEVARGWSAELAAQGWCVVSGGAYGIDAAAHRGALAAGGSSVCVLAGGVDVPYPRAHDALIARIADEGLVISKTPLGESVRRQRFLSRNRIIAAMTRATLVVEAAVRSGTGATARSAHRMNRPVLAVPGPVTSPASAGCHRMIRDAEAILACEPSEVMDLLDFARRAEHEPSTSTVRCARDQLGTRECRVLDAFPSRGMVGPDRLLAGAGLASGDVWAAVGILESAGWIEAADGGWRLVRR